MKALNKQEHIRYLNGFKRWLELLNYARSTAYLSERYLKEFLLWSEQQQVVGIENMGTPHLEAYHKHLQTRTKKDGHGALSDNYIISNINALKRFAEYLRQNEQRNWEIKLELGKTDSERKVLTQAEIKALYRAAEDGLLGIRDRAMLAVYYGCGLRRNEGRRLDTNDILLEKGLVHVRSGKGYKERYVPMGLETKRLLSDYMKVARPFLIKKENNALLLGMRGTRLTGTSLLNRLHKLCDRAGLGKTVGLHTLRHSIATHLLQSGMDLEQVSRFLGHESLESTQLYTHLFNG